MRFRKTVCIAAIICILCLLAAANCSAASYDVMKYNITPYSWDAQLRDNGDVMTWKIGNLFDGNRETYMEHACWNNESLDDIPEITFYFRNATIKDLWIRNAYDSDDDLYLQYARPYRIEVTVWVGDEYEPRGPYVFTKLSDVCDSTVDNDDWQNGYRRFSLPMQFTNVTKVDLWIKGWHKGVDSSTSKYMMRLSDLAFLPDSLDNLYNLGAYYQDYYSQNQSSSSGSAQSRPQTSQAQTQSTPVSGYATTNRANVNVRKTPDKNSQRLGVIKRAGSRVELASSRTGADGLLWYYVYSEDGIEGYIRNDFLIVEEEPASFTNDQPASDPVPESEPDTEETGMLPGEDTYVLTLTSGAGAWYTELYLNPDGSFTGHYQDWDAGVDDVYPGGEVSICDFNGQFEKIVKLTDYSYDLQMKEINVLTDEAEWVSEEVHYVRSEPWGMQGTRYVFYTEQTPISAIFNDDLELWWYGITGEQLSRDGTLGRFALMVEDSESVFWFFGDSYSNG